jgi:hypothetical protein
MHPGSRVLCWCSALPAILPRSLELCQMAAFQFYLQSGKQRKVGWVGDGSHIIFGHKIPWWKRECETVQCRDVTAIFLCEFFAQCHAVAVKVTVVCGSDCFSCQDEFLMNNPLDVKWNDEHALDFVVHLSRTFQSGLNRACYSHTRVRLMLSFPNVCLIISRVSVTLSEICTKFDAHSLSDPSRNHIRPDTRLQIKLRKKSAPPPSYVELYTLTPKVC